MSRTTGRARLACAALCLALPGLALGGGRIVPRGVQVNEPGGVGVTIPEANWENTSTGVYATGTRQGSATNWDPITAHELTVTLHCTTDQTKAFKQTERLGPRG
ncbi:hypothetical protein [Streptomyces xanthophaeus]|uniref:hypothetical protein n=1 Tax=Streptomyces xanthophaeus TaxID=67385 RepID=UPI0004CD8A5A|nr:hypothetical protein [Streptomyces xanthophaeus]